jgi:hypothetical protein
MTARNKSAAGIVSAAPARGRLVVAALFILDFAVASIARDPSRI